MMCVGNLMNIIAVISNHIGEIVSVYVFGAILMNLHAVL